MMRSPRVGFVQAAVYIHCRGETRGHRCTVVYQIVLRPGGDRFLMFFGVMADTDGEQEKKKKKTPRAWHGKNCSPAPPHMAGQERFKLSFYGEHDDDDEGQLSYHYHKRIDRKSRLPRRYCR